MTRPFWIADLASAESAWAQRERDAGHRCAFGFPIATARRLVGLMVFFSPTPLAPDEAMLDLAAYVGTQMGLFVERVVAQERFHAIVELAPDAMVIVNPAGRIVILNAEAEKLFGYARDELLGEPLERLVPELLREVHQHHRADYVNDPRARPMGVGLDLLAQRKDGSTFPVDISLSPLRAEDGLLIVAAVRDLAERRQIIERAMRSQMTRSGAPAAPSP